ncbi:hypothetical protein NON27_27565, partial [Vibrio parahaemolyticus]|nr:hypothetical protein [Vibrio parahaemolyticus]
MSSPFRGFAAPFLSRREREGARPAQPGGKGEGVTRRTLLASTAAASLPLPAFAATAAPTRANLFIGTGGHGHTYPGATVPF